MALAKARLLKPLHEQHLPVIKQALIVGGGISGMIAALEIAHQGYPVILVEKKKELGGFLRNIIKMQDGQYTSDILNKLIENFKNNPLITCYTGSEVEDISGHIGDFKAKIKTGSEYKDIDFGAAIIAAGSGIFHPRGYYSFGENKKIITQSDMEKIIEDGLTAKNIVMIQCVGSREKEGRTYCSRICCSEAIKNAINIKKKYPGTEIYVLYRDIRAYGIWESIYNTARQLGVIFIQFDENDKPKVDQQKLTVEVYDRLFGKKLILHPDYIVLSNTLIPNEDNIKLSRIFKVPLDQTGFFMEAHIKLRPVDFANEGIFVSGTAHYPKMIYESISQSSAAASRVTTIFSKETIKSEGLISRVDKEKCVGCGLCQALCPFKGMETGKEGKAEVIAAACKGCGVCGASCPNKAITMEHFTDSQLIAEVEAIANS
jgi:heterodisulfide reductase subunit A